MSGPVAKPAQRGFSVTCSQMHHKLSKPIPGCAGEVERKETNEEQWKMKETKKSQEDDSHRKCQRRVEATMDGLSRPVQGQ